MIKRSVAGNMKMGPNIREIDGMVGLGMTTPADAAIDPDLGNGVTDGVQEHRIRKTVRLSQRIEKGGEKETATVTAAAAGRGAGSEIPKGDVGVVTEIGMSVEADEARTAGPRDGKLDLMEEMITGPAVDRVLSNVLARCLPRMPPLLSARAKNQRSRRRNPTLGTLACSRQPPTL